MNRAIISDILLWVSALAILWGSVYAIGVWLPHKRGETILLHVRDANEITRGSLVRMMGTEIGYVDGIRLRPDHVDLTVRTYPGTLKIPSGALFTVQFTGLVGAKSIEVVPPSVPRPRVQGKALYLVEEPLRMKDNMKYQMDILQDLQGGAENIADFFGKKTPVEELQVNIGQAQVMTGRGIAALDRGNAQLIEAHRELHAATSKAVTGLEKFNRGTERAVAVTRPDKLRAHIDHGIELMDEIDQLLLAETQVTGEALGLQAHVNRYNVATASLGARLKQIQTAVVQLPILSTLDQAVVTSASAGSFLDDLGRAFGENGITSLLSARTAIRHFNTTLLNLGTRMDKAAGQAQQMQRTPARK